ncbi:hypothetical protein Prede_2609 [Prevotella dentalis DSM 3688]|nr:hypothetical protein Prede_2480 [Prevotella dentalis DSM 3688]AGB29842.1 hypothetical protein Prede_2609 [Prevotella dentalis DSM 3688]
MSLTVISNTSGIENQKIRLSLRKKMKDVRNRFIACFALVSLFYVYSSVFQYRNIPLNSYLINIDWIQIVLLIFSIIYFVVNFIAIQSLNEEIEDAINKKEE